MSEHTRVLITGPDSELLEKYSGKAGIALIVKTGEYRICLHCSCPKNAYHVEDTRQGQ